MNLVKKNEKQVAGAASGMPDDPWSGMVVFPAPRHGQKWH